jgi:RNA polymerase sigma-70 factor (ECF subfamily)
MERDEWMPEVAGRFPRTLLGVLTGRRPARAESDEDELDREFEARLVESSTLAFRVAFGVLRQRQDAEDVAQEAFAKAHRSFRQLRERDRFRAWLVRMTWRLAINHRRADLRRMARESGIIGQPSAASMDEDLASRERAQRLWRAIDALPDKLRIVVVLSGIEEHDVQEVARLLRLPTGTVKSRMFLGRRRLKELLHGQL